MEGRQHYIGTPNGVVVCIEQVQPGGHVSGVFYTAYRQEGIIFHTVDELLFGLEHFYDWINFPRQSTNSRTFKGTSYVVNFRKGRKKVMTDEELLEKRGELGSFVIRVQHRQNSSWQGRITWMEEDKTMSFRSIWEMIKLMEDAVNMNGDVQDITWPEE